MLPWSHPLPDALARRLGGASWQTVTVGMSDTHVFRLEQPDQPPRYLKIASLAAANPLQPEYARMHWLQGKLPVPGIEFFGADDQYEYLLLAALPGVMAFDQTLAEAIPQVVRILAEGLRLIHSIPLDDCPFAMGLDVRLAQAQARIAAGLVSGSDFELTNLHRSPQDILDEALATRPAKEDLVFTHGDYCLPNVLLHDGHLSGFIDWGRAGIADRYMDLAIAARSLTHNWGAQWTTLLFKEYGLTEVDEAKVRYYILLDELF